MSNEEIKKHKWFRCFYDFREIFICCPVLHARQLAIAMFDYAEFGIIPDNLNKKTMKLFNGFKAVLDKDRERSKEYGEQGAIKRWTREKNGRPMVHHNNKTIKK